MGRPTDYKEEYCEEIVEYFSEEPFTEREVTHSKKNGESWTTYEDVANAFPTFAGFAAKIGVHRDTLNEWIKVHPEFSDAYNKAKDLQEEFLVQNALKNLYAQPFAVFTAKNVLGWRDKSETDITSGGEPLQMITLDTKKEE